MAKSYESDITQFLRNLKQERPHLEAEQKKGRARLWDKSIDPELVEGFKAATVPQKPYVYQTDH
ncbi:DUF3460 family protein [Pigmentiphaga sp.]|jgi:Protein of unknown function (DUF3460).|uniref:DUF3460 family protein n=1 Tax=Pigmentiphaga sp. TaxID=1977564 RepID=UPI0025F4B54C|nr:DUF3460 family protein [Pigmentiphaga sp.]MBX6320156.1 DUF3460 family protein [Pigmentiphaga sp.]